MEAVVCHSHNWSEDLSPTLVLYLANASFLQHVVTHITEHFKLLETSEFSTLGSLTDNLEQVSFEHGLFP